MGLIRAWVFSCVFFAFPKCSEFFSGYGGDRCLEVDSLEVQRFSIEYRGFRVEGLGFRV